MTQRLHTDYTTEIWFDYYPRCIRRGRVATSKDQLESNLKTRIRACGHGSKGGSDSCVTMDDKSEKGSEIQFIIRISGRPIIVEKRTGADVRKRTQKENGGLRCKIAYAVPPRVVTFYPGWTSKRKKSARIFAGLLARLSLITPWHT